MPRHEDPAEDPQIIEAIINIKTAIRRIAPMQGKVAIGWHEEIDEALAELEQAVRFLEGKEEPT